MQPIVSFSIASYNRGDLTLRLVKDLLSIDDFRIEVLVVDDCSTDDTLTKLADLEDSRLRVYKHTQNMGPKITWYDVYEQACGEWIFCINDRDVVNLHYYERLISTLEELKQNKIGFVVAGEKWGKDVCKDYQMFKAGFDTIAEFGLREQHPTGQIIRRKCWLQIKDRKKYFSEERYGIYPHGFIEAIIGNSYPGAYILFDICDKEHYSQRMKWMYPSCVYGKNGNEYFLPSQQFHLLELLIENCLLIEDQSMIKQFILERYERWMKGATVGFYYAINNDVIKRRYGYLGTTISLDEIVTIGKKFIVSFRQYIENREYNWLDDGFYDELENLERMLLTKIEDWVMTRKYECMDSAYCEVILFGMGRRGHRALEGGYNIKGICDNNVNLVGKIMNGMLVRTLEDCKEIYNSRTIFLITPIEMEASTFIAKQLIQKGYRFQFMK